MPVWSTASSCTRKPRGWIVRRIPAIWASVSTKTYRRKPGLAGFPTRRCLVNENRLNLADIRARRYLAQQMENYFFGEGADRPEGYVPPSA